LRAVYFELAGAGARRVAIAGTFNEWRPGATPMVNMGHGRWRKVLVLPPGTYEYSFVVDGRWIADPLPASINSNQFAAVSSVRVVR
jgi:1,4-alpha-glucan branching enzyme